MPADPNSRESPIVKVSAAPLDAAYQTWVLGDPFVAATDEMLTIAPPLPPRSFDILRMASRQTYKSPKRLVSTTRRTSVRSASASFPCGDALTPALLTR